MKSFRTLRFSNRSSKLLWIFWIVVLLTIVILLFPRHAFGSEKVIYTFSNGNDGAGPSDLLADTTGDLFGTALSGGPEGAGTVFELSPPARQSGVWTETTLYSFSYNGFNGIGPKAGLLIDSAGNLYGTTWLGGANGGGIAFELSPPAQPGGAWTFQVIYNFPGTPTGGYSPEAPLTMDGNGNLFGTTVEGGNGNCIGGCGTVFKLTPAAQSGGAWTGDLYSFP